jgi:hypothetical protein
VLEQSSRRRSRRYNDDVCKTLNLNGDSSARETVAVRIIDLARGGERSPTRLRDRVLHEAAMAGRVGLNGDHKKQHEEMANAWTLVANEHKQTPRKIQAETH